MLRDTKFSPPSGPAPGGPRGGGGGIPPTTPLPFTIFPFEAASGRHPVATHKA